MREGAPADAGGASSAGEAPAGGAPSVDNRLSIDAEPSDEQLMKAYAGGDAVAFEQLYARHRGPLYRYYRRQLSEAEAHDCFQTLWLKIVHYQDRYSPDAPFRHYLFTLAHNVLMDHYRDHRRRGSHPGVTAAPEPDELPDPVAGPERQHERAELAAHLHRLILTLPAQQREAWLLRQETSFSTAEIAQVTGTSEEGVKSRLRYARDKLKQGMARYVR